MKPMKSKKQSTDRDLAYELKVSAKTIWGLDDLAEVLAENQFGKE